MTQILNWNQSCRNRKVGTVGRFQSGQKTADLCLVRVTTPPRQSVAGFWPGLEPNRTEPPVKTQTTGWLPRPIANTSWHSVDTHFPDGAGRVLQSVLPIKAAHNSCMNVCNLLAVWLPRSHDQKLLMLHWRSFSRWGRERGVIIFANKGGQY